jgi:hypothetical protein
LHLENRRLVESLYARVVKKTPMLREEITHGANTRVKLELAGDLRHQVAEATVMVCPSEVVTVRLQQMKVVPRELNFNENHRSSSFPEWRMEGVFICPESYHKRN